jgi:FkbM family methyltransferase
VNIVSFDQWLLDASLNTPVNGLGNRAIYRFLRGIRRLRLLISDPLVTFSLRAYNLRLPLSHELPFYRRNFADYAANLGKVSFYARQKYPDLTMIDVGANIGDSVAIVHSYAGIPVLCLEGEPRFFQLLKENTRNLPAVEIEQTFIGAPGDQVSSIDANGGNAQVLLGQTPGRASICTLSESLARHPRFSTAKLLKIDAEGFDCRIIASDANLLKKTKPILFFEYYPKCAELIGQKAFPVFTTLLPEPGPLFHKPHSRSARRASRSSSLHFRPGWLFRRSGLSQRRPGNRHQDTCRRICESPIKGTKQ